MIKIRLNPADHIYYAEFWNEVGLRNGELVPTPYTNVASPERQGSEILRVVNAISARNPGSVVTHGKDL